MKFILEVQKIQQEEENKKRIVIIKCGAFFIGIGKDAVILHQLLNLRTVCIQMGVCKVGIPVGSINNYMDRLENKGYSYVIYDYIKEDNKFTAIYNYDNQEIIEENNCYNCDECEYYKKNNFELNIYQILQRRKNNEK